MAKKKKNKKNLTSNPEQETDKTGKPDEEKIEIPPMKEADEEETKNSEPEPPKPVKDEDKNKDNNEEEETPAPEPEEITEEEEDPEEPQEPVTLTQDDLKKLGAGPSWLPRTLIGIAAVAVIALLLIAGYAFWLGPLNVANAIANEDFSDDIADALQVSPITAEVDSIGANVERISGSVADLTQSQLAYQEKVDERFNELEATVAQIPAIQEGLRANTEHLTQIESTLGDISSTLKEASDLINATNQSVDQKISNKGDEILECILESGATATDMRLDRLETHAFQIEQEKIEAAEKKKQENSLWNGLVGLVTTVGMLWGGTCLGAGVVDADLPFCPNSPDVRPGETLTFEEANNAQSNLLPPGYIGCDFNQPTTTMLHQATFTVESVHPDGTIIIVFNDAFPSLDQVERVCSGYNKFAPSPGHGLSDDRMFQCTKLGTRRFSCKSSPWTDSKFIVFTFWDPNGDNIKIAHVNRGCPNSFAGDLIRSACKKEISTALEQRF